MIAIEVDRYEGVPGYESWWDVPVAEVSERRVGPRGARALRGGAVIDAVVIGRVGIDLYPNELETPLSEVRTFTRFVGGFAGNVATGLARLGVADGDRLARRRRGARRLRARVAGRRGRRRPLPGHRPVLADAADLLRGLAARPLPDHVLPPADRARLAALARRLRCRGGGRGAAPLRDRHRARAVAEPRDDARRPAGPPRHDDLRPRLAARRSGTTRTSTPRSRPRRSPPRTS